MVQPKTWGLERKKILKSRWREDESRQNLEWWKYYFSIVLDSPFLLGENSKSWQADLEWLVRPRNFAKVLDGKYLKKKKRGRVQDKDPDEIFQNAFGEMMSVRDDPEFAIDAEGRTVNA